MTKDEFRRYMRGIERDAMRSAIETVTALEGAAPEPLCATCRHWTGELNAEGRADCLKLRKLSDLSGDEWGWRLRDALVVAWPECGHDGRAVTFETRPEFGCVLWRNKEES